MMPVGRVAATETAEALVDTIHEALERGCDCDVPAVCEFTDVALAALASLAARLQVAEAGEHAAAILLTDVAELEARAVAAERERDEAVKRSGT